MVAPPHTTPPDHDLEILSAYLDGELSDRERASLEQRLNRDDELRAALDELRDTVAMVRDLPSLKAPRNFTLDPAIYRRSIPWWQQLFTLGTVLQLSGAVGTIAAIMIIASALVLGSSSTSDKVSPQSTAFEQAAEPGTIAMAPILTRTRVPPGTVTKAFTPAATLYAANQATAIANANTDAAAFDATLEAQSEMYASTEVFGTMTALAATATATSMPAIEEGSSFAASSDAESAENDMAMGAPPQPQELIPSPQPEGPTMLQIQPPPGDSDAGAQSIGTPESALDMTNSGPAADDNADAMRQGEANATATATPAPTQTQMPTVTLSTSSETLADQNGQLSPADETEYPTAIAPMMEKHAVKQNKSDNYVWLAGIGGILLVMSLAVFVVGLRRSRRA